MMPCRPRYVDVPDYLVAAGVNVSRMSLAPMTEIPHLGAASGVVGGPTGTTSRGILEVVTVVRGVIATSVIVLPRVPAGIPPPSMGPRGARGSDPRLVRMSAASCVAGSTSRSLLLLRPPRLLALLPALIPTSCMWHGATWIHLRRTAR